MLGHSVFLGAMVDPKTWLRCRAAWAVPDTVLHLIGGWGDTGPYSQDALKNHSDYRLLPCCSRQRCHA